MTNPKAATFLTAYVIGAFLTFGHVFNMNYVGPPEFADCSKMEKYEAEWLSCTNNNIDAKYSRGNAADAFFPALAAGAVWPIYWGGHFAIKVTK